MTNSTQPIVPTDFSIQVAENEGMPTRPNCSASPLPAAPTRRLTGTLTLRSSKTHASNCELWSAREQGPMKQPLVSLLARTAAMRVSIGCRLRYSFAQSTPVIAMLNVH